MGIGSKIKNYFNKRGGVAQVIRKRLGQIINGAEKVTQAADYIVEMMVILEQAFPDIPGTEKAQALIASLLRLTGKTQADAAALRTVIDEAHTAFLALRGGVK